jgi:hypothetical protein
VIHNLIANIGQCKHCNGLVHFFLRGENVFTLDSNDITSAHGILHCHKTRVPCRDQLVISGL